MTYDLVIHDARILDGTGAPPFRGGVAVRGERIAAVGDLAGATAETVIDAAGRHLAPGFIDVHTHDDTNVIRTPAMLPKLSQGVTTVVVGNCGISVKPATAWRTWCTSPRCSPTTRYCAPPCTGTRHRIIGGCFLTDDARQ